MYLRAFRHMHVNVCPRHAAVIENTASDDSNRSGKLNLIQLSRSVAVIVCDTLAWSSSKNDLGTQST